MKKVNLLVPPREETFMSDITIAFNAPVKRTIDGKDYSFPKFSPVEIASECARIKQKSVEQARRLVKEHQITGLDALRVVKGAEDAEPIVNAVWIDATTPENAIRYVKESLKNQGLDDAAALDLIKKLATDDLVALALDILGYKEEEKKGDKDKNPDKTETQKDDAKGFKRG